MWTDEGWSSMPHAVKKMGKYMFNLTKMRNLFVFMSLIIVIVTLFILNEICYQIIKYNSHSDMLVSTLNFIRYIAAFFALLGVFPLGNKLYCIYEKKIMSERYGKDWLLLSDEERNMIETILLEEKAHGNYDIKASSPYVQEKAKRRVSEK